MTGDTGPTPFVAPRAQEIAKTGIPERKPHWRLTTDNPDGAGITKVTFSIDLHELTETAYEAMRELTAAALWWLDTDAGGLWNNLPGAVEQASTGPTPAAPSEH